MAVINFSKRMSIQRPFSPCREADGEYGIIRSFESDRGRILNSAAIRRLQQKTQVFPLERNASVRSRLTHSMEVQQVGRYIAKEILNRLEMANRLGSDGLSHYKGAFETLVEMGCLMHDIGNPPFGHAGERTINEWFTRHLSASGENASALFHHFQRVSLENDLLRDKLCHDLCHFEGNAQGIRIVYSLQKLNLTYAQTACILKYTRPAYLATEKIPKTHSYLMKKPGYFLSEEHFVKQLWQELDMGEHNRHPLAYIMESADDISYCIADLEDAVEKSIFTVDELFKYLTLSWQRHHGKSHHGDLFNQIVLKAYQMSQELPKTSYRTQSDQFFMTLRVETINALVAFVADRFIEHLEPIFAGTFDAAILSDPPSLKTEACCLLKIYKDVAYQYVFSHQEVLDLEEQGRQILNGLLDHYLPILLVPDIAFSQLVKEEMHPDYARESELYRRLSPKHCQAYKQALEQNIVRYPIEQRPLWEFYYRCRLIQDYISGMTDHYAQDEYVKINKA